MPDDYIKRSDALEVTFTLDDEIDIDGARRFINAIPAADVAPVKHGRWVEETDRYNHWHCSECGYVIGVMKMDSRYCLKCGAKMQKEEDDGRQYSRRTEI